MNYFKILHFLEKGNKELFECSVEDQQAFMEALGTPRDDIDRGYKQYLCQNYFVPTWKVWTLNVVSVFATPFLLLFFLIKGIFVRKEKHIGSMIERKGMDEVVPNVVWEKYHPDSKKWKEGASLRWSDVLFIIKLIIRAPHHPYFAFKACMNVAVYSDMIYRHSPQVMIHFGEFSFKSSILTDYCHRHQVKHVNIMHGEKLFFIRDAFFHYDECYVWDDYYVEMFKSLKAEPTQFRIALPQSLCIDVEKNKNQFLYADFKYYLGENTEEEICSIVQSMKMIKTSGKTVKFRPHPRYSDLGLLKKYIPESEIEYPKEVSIIDSISNLEYAVGSYSTVLLQAWCSRQKVILDDVTYKDLYNKLAEFGYILAQKNCEKLSNYQK